MTTDKLAIGDTITEAELDAHIINRIGTTTELAAEAGYAIGHVVYDTTISKFKKVVNTVGPVFSIIDVIGSQDIPLGAGFATLPVINGADFLTRDIATSILPIASLNFDSAANEKAYFTFTPPEGWDVSEAIKIAAVWTQIGGGTSEDIELDYKATSFADGQNLQSLTWGATTTITDNVQGNDYRHKTAFSGNIAVGNSPAKGDTLVIEVLRNTAADTLSVDLELLEIIVRLKIDDAVSTTL